MKVTEVSPTPTSEQRRERGRVRCGRHAVHGEGDGRDGETPPVIAQAVRTTGSIPRKRRTKFSAIA